MFALCDDLSRAFPQKEERKAKEKKERKRFPILFKLKSYFLKMEIYSITKSVNGKNFASILSCDSKIEKIDRSCQRKSKINLNLTSVPPCKGCVEVK